MKFRIKGLVHAGVYYRRYFSIERWRGYQKARVGIYRVPTLMGNYQLWFRLPTSVIVFSKECN